MVLSKAVALLLVALLVGGVRALTASTDLSGPDLDPDAVVASARSMGAEIHFHIGREQEGGLRGALADQAFQPGESIAKVPFTATIPLGDYTKWPAEQAYELARRLHLDASFNATFGAWWASQPPPEDLLARETFPADLVGELQNSDLVKMITNTQAVVVYYWAGGEGLPALNEVISPAHMSLDAFSHLVALVSTRDFYFSINDSDPQNFLVPAVEMLNHGGEGGKGEGAANADFYNDDEFVYIEATAPIQKGQEIRIDYKPGFVHRPDVAFSLYGFVPRQAPQLLCAIDLPHYNSSALYLETELTDEEFDPHGHHAIREEISRVEAILQGLPTTLDQDQQLLAREEVAGNWKAATVLQLRVERKRALAHRAQRLRGLLNEL